MIKYIKAIIRLHREIDEAATEIFDIKKWKNRKKFFWFPRVSCASNNIIWMKEGIELQVVFLYNTADLKSSKVLFKSNGVVSLKATKYLTKDEYVLEVLKSK